MDLEIIEVQLEGNEYILLRAIQTCDLTDYVIRDCTYNNKGKESNKFPHTFWFNDHYSEYWVKSGDFILLYTCRGRYDWFYNEAGTTTHKFFWNLDVEVWNNTGDNAYVVKIDGIKRRWLKVNKILKAISPRY